MIDLNINATVFANDNTAKQVLGKNLQKFKRVSDSVFPLLLYCMVSIPKASTVPVITIFCTNLSQLRTADKPFGVLNGITLPEVMVLKQTGEGQ